MNWLLYQVFVGALSIVTGIAVARYFFGRR